MKMLMPIIKLFLFMLLFIKCPVWSYSYTSQDSKIEDWYFIKHCTWCIIMATSFTDDGAATWIRVGKAQ